MQSAQRLATEKAILCNDNAIPHLTIFVRYNAIEFIPTATILSAFCKCLMIYKMLYPNILFSQ